MELIDLKKMIKERLEDLTSLNVYDTNVTVDKEFPYVTYNFQNAPNNSISAFRTDRILELDFWDETNDDKALLDAAEAIKNGNEEYDGFNWSRQNEIEGFYRCYIENDIHEIPEPDNNITHLRQTYLLYYY